MISNRDRLAGALLDTSSDDWRAGTPCRADPELWFSIDAKGAEEAKSICRNQCKVREQCLADALGRGEPWGVWGGLDEYERRGMKRPNSRLSPPWSDDELAELKRLAALGLNGADIAQRLGRTYDAIKWMAGRHRITLQRTGAAIDDDKASRVIELIRAGRSTYVIAAEMKVTTQTVQRWKAKLREVAA